MVTVIRQQSDRRKKILCSLFPSYVFLNPRSQKDLYHALSIKSVFNCLRFDQGYAVVRNEEIYKIKQILSLESLSEIHVTEMGPQIGDKVRINYGSLSRLQCEVININNKNKILVRIDSLRQNNIATVPSNFITLMD